MAKKRASRSSTSRGSSGDTSPPASLLFDSGERTGRMIVTFRDGSANGIKKGVAAIQNVAGINSVNSMANYSVQSLDMDEANSADALVMDQLGIAVVNMDEDQHQAFRAASTDDDGMIMEPEYVNFALADLLDDDQLESQAPSQQMPVFPFPVLPHLEYLRGYHEAVKHLYETLKGPSAQSIGFSGATLAATGGFQDTAVATWGLNATGVLNSTFSGRGIKVAILDTGLDTRHPDFQGRQISTQSFITGESAMDVHGHGTHCTGTACGPLRPSEGPRYGVAWEAEIFHGKVLSNSGSGGDGGILAAINWALQTGCHVISMSLGRKVRVGEQPMAAYETAGKRALESGALIIAAAGNDSDRPSSTFPVGSPANAPSIVSVGAVDQNLQIARFSNAGINQNGGEINLAGPGVAIRSSLPLPRKYAAWSGTSMATPHVAGIAALVAQQSASFRGIALYRELRRRAQRLNLPPADGGNGLVRAI